MAFIGGLPFSPLMGFGGMGFGGGLGGCCDGLLGSPGNGALTGGLAGGLTGMLFSGGNPLGALLGGGIGAAIGGLIGRHNQNHHHHGHHHGHHNHQCPPQFPPPYGGGYGGPGLGGYGGGYGPGFPGQFPGGYGQQQGYYPQGAYQQGYQQGFQQGQYQAGYQQGYQAGMGYGQPGMGYGQPGMGYGPQGGYPGCMPPGGGWNNGCQPNNQCFPPQYGTGNPGGHLSQCEPGKPISYRTSGGWNVKVDGDKVIITDPSGKQKVEHSGDPHEYVNGKHVKDWEGKQRSVVLPDGTKITMGATAPNGVVTNTSIYDGDQNIQIKNAGNEITSRSFNPYDTRMREAYQYDGETARISYNDKGGINYNNLYTQDENFGLRSNHKDIATTNNPRWWERPFMPFWGAGQQSVKDHYNDPRLLFT